ncbi:MAG: right-handed parallel beta-helix repeat-containing protein [Synechococcales bacterium]|nr:right-handed parallel beta-helix repeat-containing protein [Synechococcales bacterium]
MSFETNPFDTSSTFANAWTSRKSYFVATTGDDFNPGTFDRPFHSLQAAINQIGDGEGGDIYIRGGTYYASEEPFVSEFNDGREDSRLTIQAYQNEQVILDGLGVALSGISIAGSYVDVIGLEMRYAQQGITGVRPQHLRLIDNTIYSTYSTGIGIYGIDSRSSKDILVQGNKVYYTNINNSPRIDYAWGSGIAISLTQDAIVRDNLVFNNWGEGIAITLSDNAIASGNYLYDNYSVNLYMDNATNSVFEKNFVFNTGNYEFYRPLDGRIDYQPAYGIMFANEEYSVGQNYLNNNIVRNNILVNTLGILMTGIFKNGQVINNTVYGSRESLLYIDEGDYENILIANNIFYQTSWMSPVYLPSSWFADQYLPWGIWVTHNNWVNGNPSSLVISSSDIFLDPFFVNPGGSNPNDYQLHYYSPAIDRGSFDELVTLDFGQRWRSQDGNGDGFFKIDLGAFEFDWSYDWIRYAWV